MAFEGEGGNPGEPSRARPRYTTASVVKCAIVGVIGAFVLSWIYGFLDYICPIVYLNFVLTFGMGWLVGGVCARALRVARLNGKSAARWVGAISGIAAVYFSWIAYIWVIADYDFEFASRFFSPFSIWELADYISHNPVWSVGRSSSTLPSIMYKFVWLVEALALIALPAMGATSFVDENRLCETCGDWIGKTEDMACFALPDDPAEAVSALSQGNPAPLLSLQRISPDDETGAWIETVGYACPQCKDAQEFANVSLVTMELNNKSKKLERKERLLSRHIPIDAEMETLIFDAPIVEKTPEDPDSGDAVVEETEAGGDAAMAADRNESVPAQ